MAPFLEKLRERYFRWYIHVIGTDGNSLAKIGLSIEVAGKRPKARPRQRWFDMLDDNLRASRLHQGQAYERGKWRNRPRQIVFPAERDKS